MDWALRKFVGKGLHERYYYCINIAYISAILWGYVLIWYSCRDYCVDTKENLVEILYFRHFAKHFMFTSEGEKIRNKHLKNYFDVSVVVDIGCGNTNGK